MSGKKLTEAEVRKIRKEASKFPGLKEEPRDPDTTPDWTKECEVCGQTPVVPFCGLCGPCTFGEADTTGGNW